MKKEKPEKERDGKRKNGDLYDTKSTPDGRTDGRFDGQIRLALSKSEKVRKVNDEKKI